MYRADFIHVALSRMWPVLSCHRDITMLTVFARGGRPLIFCLLYDRDILVEFYPFGHVHPSVQSSTTYSSQDMEAT